MTTPRSSAVFLSSALLFACLYVAPAGSESIPEKGTVTTLPPVGAHWVWVPDRLFAHSRLFDGDTGAMMGAIDGGTTFTPKPPFLSRKRNELYAVEIDYARGRRGDRVDYVTIYDAESLAVTGEIVLPTKATETNTSIGYTALFDEERYLGVTNLFPRASVTIVDVENRRVAGEILAAGCTGVYPTGSRSFASLCGSGTVLELSFDDSGARTDRSESAKFFDAVKDPVMLVGVRRDEHRWLWISYAGMAHEVDFSKSPPEAASWSLVGDSDRGWRPGGLQHTAIHRDSQRLYVLFHEGGPGSHEESGPEVWVYDLSRRERVSRIPMPNLAARFTSASLGVDEGGFFDWLIHRLVPNGGAHTIAVTRDDQPLLFARHHDLGVVAVLDARSGKLLRYIDEAGLFGPTLEIP